MERKISRAKSCLVNGKKFPEELETPEFLTALSLSLSNELDRPDNYLFSPSECAHALCLSSKNGYSEIVQILSKRPKDEFNNAYTFHEPLAKAIKSWIRGRKITNDRQLQSRYEECAKYLIAAGADINVPEKYLKTIISPAQRLRKDGSAEALQFLEELAKLSAEAIPVESTAEDQQVDVSKDSQKKRDATHEDVRPAKKRRRPRGVWVFPADF
jgi:hypothetical protein